MNKGLSLLLAGVLAWSVSGCDRGHDHDKSETHEHTHDQSGEDGEESTPSGRIAIPDGVRRNLGITFARAEYRRVEATLRVPGRFELPPTARHELRAPFGGRVELLVRQYDRVRAGDLVARISSPEWHRLQLELEEDGADVARARAELTIAEQSLAEGRNKVKLLEERVSRLAAVEVKRIELDTELAAARNALPRLEAEVAAKQAAFEAARHHLPLAETAAASQLGMTRERLIEEVTTPRGLQPRWQAMSYVEVYALSDGVVDMVAVADGGRVDALGALVTVIDTTQVRFRAVALQADLAKLRDGQSATIIAPADRGNGLLSPVVAKVTLSPEANADQRTIDLLVHSETMQPWCRPGVSGFVEIPWTQASEELAIPVKAVIQDGLTKVFYLRDQKNPDAVIRTEADLGTSDGRWVVVNSGLMEGDEVVLDGIYELKLAGNQQNDPVKGGHFHADGSWHAEGQPEKGGKK